MFESLNFNEILDVYLIPWGIKIISALVILYLGNLVSKMILRLITKLLTKAKLDTTLINFVSSLVRMLVLVFVIIAALDKIGVETTSLVAILGAAGLAVGLALQGSLQNFAAGILLVIFKTFKVGDYVEAGGISGSVEEISIFNTTFKTPDNKIIIVPNGVIYGGSITNYTTEKRRRIDLVIGVGYNDDIKKVKDILTQIINAEDRVLKEPKPQIVVGELGDSSVNFYVRPWVKTSDYWDVKFYLTEKIKLTFDEQGISIPYPQMDIHLNKIEN